MEKSSNSDFLVNIAFQNDNFFTYKNPSDTRCIQFSGCTYWETAKTVRWQNLPSHWRIDFYQNKDCTSKDGDVHHEADSTAITGLHTFETARPIRSIHARPALGKSSFMVTERCVILRKHGGIYESENRTESNYGVWLNDSSEAAGASSSNWFDPIEH
eukprot:jgi/Phyca11/124765/e_gw1.55.271.1